MNVLGQYLDERDDDRRNDAAARSTSGRDTSSEEAFRVWLDGDRQPEERLIKFDAWIRAQLAARLVWPADEGKARRQLEQARVHLERVVLDLWRRGWYLDGKALAARLVELLDAGGKYQRAGKVADFWPYFRATVDRYVGLNSEEIRDQAMRAGSHVGQLMAALTRSGAAQAPKLGDLIEARHQETLRAKLAAERAKQARCKADADQPQLF
jgi:hypothetical protein